MTLTWVPRSCVSIKGNTYWANLSITADFLLCFDFTQERFKRMCLPQLSHGGNVLSAVGDEKLAVLLQSNLTESMDIWVTNKIDTDTEAALKWSKSLTLDHIINCVPIPISFVLDEEKQMVMFCC